MNNLMFFENKQVEVFEFNGQILFNPKHVAECLDIKNVNDNIAKMNDKQVIKLTNSKIGNSDFRKLHNTGENFLTESGVYKLIFKSKKKEAEKFQDWVTDEVLPTIRKHGMYARDEILDNPDLLIEVATQLKQEREQRKQLELEKAMLIQENNELKPKADYTDMVLQNKSLMTVTAIAKDYGMSGGSLNKKLHELGIQYKQGGQWFLYAKHQAKGYTSSSTTKIEHTDGRVEIKLHTKWTQKGRLFIYNELKKVGIVPLIEQDVAC